MAKSLIKEELEASFYNNESENFSKIIPFKEDSKISLKAGLTIELKNVILK
jgi:hypothetical protein